MTAEETKKRAEEAHWVAIRNLTPEQRRAKFLRHNDELAAQALAKGEVTDVAEFGRAL